MTESSDLSFIEIKNPTNPAILFDEWINEAKQCGVKEFLMNLATATKNGKVSNRTVLIRDILPDACLVLLAQANSNKIKEIKENPQVAATVLLMYSNNTQKISKQIRFVGTAEKLPHCQSQIYFEADCLSGKIRSLICQDCKATDWKELKAKHDELLRDVTENKKVLQMPDTLVAYKIIPCEMDFYFSENYKIADRILFTKQDNALWKYERIMP